MNVFPVKTRILLPPQDDLFEVLLLSLPKISERTILVITSKAVSIWEGRCLLQEKYTRAELVPKEAEYYFPETKVALGEYQAAIKHNAFIASAGIDKSNSGKYLTLLPADPFASAKKIWEWARSNYGVKEVGVLITDSHLMPMRRGTVGLSIGFYGFEPLTDYRGKADLFGEPLKVTLRNLADGFAAAAVVAMGEGSESTPVALITDIPFVQFTDKPYPKQKSGEGILVPPEEDVFYPLLKNADWKKGEGGVKI